MPRPERDQGNTKNQRPYWHDHALVWAAVAAAVGAGLAAGASAYQAYLTRQNNILSQRAFVYAEPTLHFISVKLQKDGSKHFRVFFPLVNKGSTATKDLEFFVRCAPTIDVLPEPWVLLFREKPAGIRQFIGPAQSVSAMCTFPEDHLRQMQAGKAHGYLMGQITYQNRIDYSHHETQFSWEILDVNIIEPQTPDAPPVIAFFNAHPVGRHNCADEECPKN